MEKKNKIKGTILVEFEMAKMNGKQVDANQ